MKMLHTLLPAVLAVGILAAAVPAEAAEPPPEEGAAPAAAEPAPAEPAPAEPTPAEPATDEPDDAPPGDAPPSSDLDLKPEDMGVVEPETGAAADRTWAKRRGIKVIEKRPFRKETRHEFTFFVGTIPNDDFFTYVPLGLRYDHYFSEDIGMELWGSYIIEAESGLSDTIEGNTAGALSVDIPQTLVFMAGVDLIWSPIHGKLAVLDSLASFDFYLALGAGVIGTNIKRSAAGDEFLKVDVSGNIGLGVQLYITEAFSMRLDYRQYLYASETGGLAYPAELTLGFSLWTEAPK